MKLKNILKIIILTFMINKVFSSDKTVVNHKQDNDSMKVPLDESLKISTINYDNKNQENNYNQISGGYLVDEKKQLDKKEYLGVFIHEQADLYRKKAEKELFDKKKDLYKNTYLVEIISLISVIFLYFLSCLYIFLYQKIKQHKLLNT
jgi:hypothetical protein